MRGLEVKSHPIFFDYSPGDYHMPRGIVDLLSSRRAPWVYIDSTIDSLDRNKNSMVSETCENFVCNRNGTSSCTHDGEFLNNNNTTINEDKKTHNNAILTKGQQYFVEVALTLPESEINHQLGIFMVTVHLQSRDGFTLATSKQATMLPYESKIVTSFRKISLILPFASGLLSETKTIYLLCFDKYSDRNEKRPLSKVEVRLDVPNPASFPSTLHTIQIESSELRYGKEMNQIQLFFRNWRYTCVFCGVTIFFVWYSFLVLLVLHHRAKRKWHNNHIQQPYGNIFDSINGSSIGSNTGSWMGADIEVLDDDYYSDVWEQIESNSNCNVQDGSSNANDASNIISDSESSTSEKYLRKSPTEQHNAKSNSTFEFPTGTIAKNPLVQSHQPMFSSTPGTTKNEQTTVGKKDKEEKCLADMVMKGYSKWEIFTGKISV